MDKALVSCSSCPGKVASLGSAEQLSTRAAMVRVDVSWNKPVVSFMHCSRNRVHRRLDRDQSQERAANQQPFPPVSSSRMMPSSFSCQKESGWRRMHLMDGSRFLAQCLISSPSATCAAMQELPRSCIWNLLILQMFSYFNREKERAGTLNQARNWIDILGLDYPRLSSSPASSEASDARQHRQ